MILNNLSIVNFKNIQSANVNLSPKMNCLIGHNGMGKTNFLDAIHFLAFCKSAHNAIDSQLILHGQEFFMLEGVFESEKGEVENIYCAMKRGQKKHFKRNKKEYKRLSEHIGLLPLVFVSPSDSVIIEGGSEERRKLMDMVISQYDKSYITALLNYNKALQQRNVLLKMEEEPDGELMDILEHQMAEEGERIHAARDAFVKEFVPVFQGIYQRICNASETVSVEYVSHCKRGPLLDVIRRDRAKDRIMGFSLHGIHRDDLDLKLGEYPMKREGSQGQNKSFAIALKLAQFDFLRRTNSSTTPLLLLDDIFDKLDAQRVEQIVRIVGGDDFGQIFITDTNRDHLDKILTHFSFDYRIFSVENGDVILKQ
ncbi:MAG: DNA replication and repair protein RecF [Prevotella sp.]|nr:DNA replication and repair protein RecF [Prevotella sp.]